MTGRTAASIVCGALVEVGIALSSELSLEALLQRLIETAVELTGARYGALGVIDRLGTGLEQFITVGVDAETQATIGDLPARPRHPRRADPRPEAAAAPRPRPGSALGRLPARPSADGLVPRRSDHAARNRLRQPLPDREGGRRGEFSEEDEEIVRLLAAQAAVAIENARLYESSRQWSRQLESLNEVSEALASEAELSQLLELAASRLRELLDARVVLIELPTTRRPRI